MKTGRLVPDDVIAMKTRGERIAALTAYDYTSAQMMDAAGIPLILVGDTLGMVVQGEETTLPVTLEHILYHAKAVVRGTQRALIVGDMPFMTYQPSIEEAMHNAARLVQEAKVGAVKVEGGTRIAPTVKRLVSAGIPVCGHLGFTPQSTHTLGGPKMQGRGVDDALALLTDALALESAGVFAVVLELVPRSVAGVISQRLRVPAIGIGSGPECDGEIQVFHDLFGLYTDFKPRHTRRYLDIAEQVTAAALRYREDVAALRFPGPEQSSDVPPDTKTHFFARLQESGASATIKN
jgi:3-methyl-2-oxobutanoate hydroxymethyltransferase